MRSIHSPRQTKLTLEEFNHERAPLVLPQTRRRQSEGRLLSPNAVSFLPWKKSRIRAVTRAESAWSEAPL